MGLEPTLGREEPLPAPAPGSIASPLTSAAPPPQAELRVVERFMRYCFVMRERKAQTQRDMFALLGIGEGAGQAAAGFYAAGCCC